MSYCELFLNNLCQIFKLQKSSMSNACSPPGMKMATPKARIFTEKVLFPLSKESAFIAYPINISSKLIPIIQYVNISLFFLRHHVK